MNAVRRPPWLVTCFAQLALIDACTRILGLRGAFALVRRTRTQWPACDGLGVVAETARRLILAASFYPGRALCLEQSLALCALLRRRGVPAEFRLGVKPLPFVAHAWVEVNGKAVGEEHSALPGFATFALRV